MIARKNKKNRTAFVYDSFAGLETFVSKSFKNAKQGTRLTIRDGFDRVDLTGRQVKTLQRVLARASRIAATA